jgi:hypothetical protein
MTGVSVSALTAQFNEVDIDGVDTRRIHVPYRAVDVPRARLDQRACTPRHFEAISDFIDQLYRPRRTLQQMKADLRNGFYVDAGR